MKMNKISAARLLRQVAKDRVDFARNEFPDDASSLELAQSDFRDLNRIASMIEYADYNMAYNKIGDLDTAVRDEIPQLVYAFLDRMTGSVGKFYESKEIFEMLLKESIEGKSFCITGTLSMPRKDAWQMIEDNGGHVHETMHKGTTYLVTGADIGHAKLAKAEKFGVKVIDEKEFLHMVRGGRRMEKDPETWRGDANRRGKFFDEGKTNKGYGGSFSDLKVGDYFTMTDEDPDFAALEKTGPRTYKVVSAVHSDVIGMIFSVRGDEKIEYSPFKENRKITLSEFKKLLLGEQKEEMDISVARQIIRGDPYGDNKVKSYISDKMDRKPMGPQDVVSSAVVIFGNLMDHEKEAICSLDVVTLGGKRPFLSRLPESCISDEVFIAKFGNGEYFLCDTSGYDYARYVAKLAGFDESACMSDEDYMVSKMV
jgi:hypothetical protein